MKKVTRCGLFQTVHVQCVSKKAAPINYQKLVDICGHELQPNLQKKKTQERLNSSENIPKSFRWVLFLMKHPPFIYQVTTGYFTQFGEESLTV